MSVQGFRNLIKTSLISEDSFQPLLKKSEQYRKITQGSLDYFQSISKNYQTYELSNDKLLFDFFQQMETNAISIPKYFQQYLQLFRNITGEQKIFSLKLKEHFSQLTSMCKDLITSFSDLILQFQVLIRTYKTHEQNLFDLSKKYFKTHRNMISNIQAYKNSFTDVKLIYNMDEKNKRFNSCEGNYKNLLEELAVIDQKVVEISQDKANISKTYKKIQEIFIITLRTIGGKLINLCRSLAIQYCVLTQILMTYYAERKFTLQKINLQTQISAEPTILNADFFKIQVQKHDSQCAPQFMLNIKQFKDQSYCQLGKLYSLYIKQITQKIEKRKFTNKRVFELTEKYFKYFQKTYCQNLRSILINFQKNKKRLSEIFGNRLINFFKSVNSILDLTISKDQKLLKKTSAKLKFIDNFLSQENKTSDSFLKQLKNTVQKITKKKQFKRLLQERQITADTLEEQVPTQGLTALMKLQIQQKTQNIVNLIQNFNEKLKINNSKISMTYNDLIGQLSMTTSQCYSLCCEYRELYFGDEEFKINLNKFQEDIEITLKNQSQFFSQINFGIFLKDEAGKVAFDPEMNKVQEFKKLKKPMNHALQLEKPLKQEKQKNGNKELTEQCESVENKSLLDRNIIGLGKQQIKKQKYEQFLRSKIVFVDQQKFYKSFSCGLSDKIILQGRLYITNFRLCFHSKFNPNNVFFGETFIQIPRKDIKKIQKRMNAIVFDNSISITTVNGQVFLTSFFSRNQAYDLICQSMEICNDQVMFEPEEPALLIEEEPEQTDHEDDLKDIQINQRSQRIGQLLSTYQYKPLHQAQFYSQGLTVFKFFKMFEMVQQFKFNRKTFKSFNYYIKDAIGHTSVQIEDWTPSISNYLNSTNIKANTPDKFTKLIHCMVPIANTGVPFMPKFAKSEQKVNLFFISKHKFIVQSTIQNCGVPYSDCFDIRLRKIYESTQEYKCLVTVLFHVNFHTTTIMKSIIETKSFQETRIAQVIYEQEIKKYFKHLQKIKLLCKPVKRQIGSSEQQDESSLQYAKQTQVQMQQVQQENNKLKRKIQQSENQSNLFKRLMIISFLINVVLIFLIIFT